MAPSLDPLESRQLLSTVAIPMHSPVLEHHHHGMRTHHVAAVGSVHSGHHGGADPAGTVTASTASTSFKVVAQFNNASFAATAAIADNDIWAVGESNPSGTQETLAVHSNGTSWSVVPTPALSTGGSFAGVAAAASNDVWAVGAQSAGSSSNTLIEHWDGTSWSIVSSPPLPNGGFLTGVTAVSSKNAWAVGTAIGSSNALVEHWDGTGWSIVSSPAFTGVGVGGISADGSKDVWAVGGPTKLHFDGTSWSLMPAPTQVSTGAVTVLSPTNAWAVGGGPGPPPSDTEVRTVNASQSLEDHTDRQRIVETRVS
jgi:hypothetical protein